MALQQERSPHEQETLIFPSQEEAKGWAERVGDRLKREDRRGVSKRREVVAEEVAKEFERYGEGVGTVPLPWEHTQEEHSEAQRLIDLAFERDLPAALRKARASGHYPRNIDLFHDVLTAEMYDLVREHKLHRQPVGWWIAAFMAVVIIAAGVTLWVAIL